MKIFIRPLNTLQNLNHITYGLQEFMKNTDSREWSLYRQSNLIVNDTDPIDDDDNPILG